MKKALFLLFMVAITNHLIGQSLAIIPQPSQVTIGKGSFVLNKTTGITFESSNEELKSIAAAFNEYLNIYYKFTLPVNEKKNDVISFKLIKSTPFGDEGYNPVNTYKASPLKRSFVGI